MGNEERWNQPELDCIAALVTERDDRDAAIRERDEALASAHGLTLLVGETAVERDAAIRRAAAAETEADTCRAKAARAEDAQDAWVRHVLQADERIAAAEADTVARIADWLERLGYMSPEHVALVRAGAWCGKEGA